LKKKRTKKKGVLESAENGKRLLQIKEEHQGG
jgi:hypothetical protein